MKIYMLIIAFLALGGFSLYGCHIKLINNTHINVLVKDQELSEIFRVDAGKSCIVGSKDRLPTIIIFMQVDKYYGAPYKKEFTIKQIACNNDPMTPITARMSDIINNSFDHALFKRTELAHVHKNLKPGGRR